jgi:hypothetical protein
MKPKFITDDYTWRTRSSTNKSDTRPSNGQLNLTMKIPADNSNEDEDTDQANGQGSGSSAGQGSSLSRKQTFKNKQIDKLSGGHRVRTRTREREDDIWMMGGRCLAVTFMAHNRALCWNTIADIVVVIVLAALPAICEILRLRSDPGDVRPGLASLGQSPVRYCISPSPSSRI